MNLLQKLVAGNTSSYVLDTKDNGTNRFVSHCHEQCGDLRRGLTQVPRAIVAVVAPTSCLDEGMQGLEKDNSMRKSSA